MSAFLGPIHTKMYGRILYQDEIAQAMLDLSDRKGWSDGLRKTVDSKASAASKLPLEDIIDQGNIHGWLSKATAVCERRFALIAGGIMSGHPERMAELQNIMLNFGRQSGISAQSDAEQAYVAVHDILLDGMPCDFPFNITVSGADEVIWQVTSCPHAPYWNAEGYDAETYYLLRDAWIEGALEESRITHTRSGGNNTMRKE